MKLLAERDAGGPAPEPAPGPERERRITQIKPGLRDASRVNIYVNHKFLCSLTLLQFNNLDLKVGQALDAAAQAELVGLSNYGKLYQRALEWATLRPRSRKEARDYLANKQRRRELDWRRYEEFLEKYRSDPEFREKVRAERERVRELNERARNTDFTENNTFEYTKRYRTRYPTKPGARISDADIEQVLVDLSAAGLLDDELFARAYVESRKTTTGISQRRLQMELFKKGITGEIVERVLAESDRNSADELQKVIVSKRRRYPDDQKLIAYLVRQGFSFQEARDGLDRYQAEHEADAPPA